MAKAFTQEQKEKIKEKLLIEGRHLFEKYGLTKTTVDDIVERIGISKGAFYLFYPTKESLFFEIIEKVEREFKTKLYEELENTIENPYEILKSMLYKGLEFIESTPLLKNISAKEMKYLYRTIPEDIIKNHMNIDISQYIDFISKQMELGNFEKRDLNCLKGYFKLFGLLIVNRDEFNEFEYKKTLEILVDSLLDYLKKR